MPFMFPFGKTKMLSDCNHSSICVVHSFGHKVRVDMVVCVNRLEKRSWMVEKQ